MTNKGVVHNDIDLYTDNDHNDEEEDGYSKEELVQYGFEVIVKAFDTQKQRLKNQIAHLHKIITELLKENSYLKSQNDNYYRENIHMRTILEKNSLKLYTIQKTVLEDNRPRLRLSREEAIDNKNSIEPNYCKERTIYRSVSSKAIKLNKTQCIPNKDNDIGKTGITKEFFDKCKERLDDDAYKQILLLFEQYNERNLKDGYVIKEIQSLLKGDDGLLEIFNKLIN